MISKALSVSIFKCMMNGEKGFSGVRE